MENAVVVGTGDVFHRFLAPTLEILELQQLVNTVSTVDIKERPLLEYLSEKIEHRIRTTDEELSDLLQDFRNRSPIVVLAHDNDMHYEDTKDLVEKEFRVMLEKPYAVDRSELDSLRELDKENPGKIFFMDYYLMRKMSPLFLFSGLIKEDSFYVGTEEVFREREAPHPRLSSYLGKLEEIIGKPVSLKVKILESQGDSGRLDHRGSHVFDSRRGGGMIQDMAIHAFMPVFALSDYFGNVDLSFSEGEVKTARSREFQNMATQKYNLPEEFIAETYAEINFSTSKNVPIEISVGKYIANIPTQKNLVLQGTKGKLDLNMHENFMYIYKERTLMDRLDLINTKRNRYYPVIRGGLEFLNGRNPFYRNISEITLNAQELTLNVLNATSSRTTKVYDNGENPKKIFKK